MMELLLLLLRIGFRAMHNGISEAAMLLSGVMSGRA
jgi:hypothetical protein